MPIKLTVTPSDKHVRVSTTEKGEDGNDVSSEIILEPFDPSFDFFPSEVLSVTVEEFVPGPPEEPDPELDL